MLCSRKLPLAKTFGVRSLGRGDALRPLDLTPFLFPRLLGGSISPDRKLPSGKPGPPCKSGQLKKDLGLEMSSARHAALLIIFEFIRSFFVGSNGSSPKWNLKIDGHPCQSEALS